MSCWKNKCFFFRFFWNFIPKFSCISIKSVVPCSDFNSHVKWQKWCKSHTIRSNNSFEMQISKLSINDNTRMLCLVWIKQMSIYLPHFVCSIELENRTVWKKSLDSYTNICHSTKADQTHSVNRNSCTNSSPKMVQ